MAGMARLNAGASVYVPMFWPNEETRAWEVVDRANAGAVMVAAESDPAPAVMLPGVIVKPLTGIVRGIDSSVPAALVGVDALTVRAHAAPVPRASVIVHSEEATPVEVWVFDPSSVTPVRVAP